MIKIILIKKTNSNNKIEDNNDSKIKSHKFKSNQMEIEKNISNKFVIMNNSEHQKLNSPSKETKIDNNVSTNINNNKSTKSITK